MLRFNDWIRARLVRSPDDEGAGAGGAGAGADPAGAGAPPGGDAAPAGGDGGAAGAGAAAAASWFDKADPELRDWINAKGYAMPDPAEAAIRAAKGQREAEKRLGAGVDKLLAKPDDGQSLSDYLHKNRDVFGVPETAEGYQIDKPDLPEGVEWDSGFEGKARAKAHELGLSNDQLKGMTALYAEYTSGIAEAVEQSETAAKATLRAALEKDWGAETDARMAMARQAAQAMAEQAGLDQASLSATIALLSKEAGDAGVLRMFAAIGQAMGEDGIKGFGKGASGFGTTPAEAKLRLEAIQSPTGDLARARKANDQKAEARLLAEVKSLTQIAAGG